MLADVFFYLFAALLVTSACCVVGARNPVHSVLFLILAFFNGAGLMLLLGAEFLAFILVIVYVGAVAVLFLFVVMMLDVGSDTRPLRMRYLPTGLLVGAVLLVELVLVAGASGNLAGEIVPPQKEMTNTEAIGAVLYTDYFVPFQLAGAILLAAMVGAIVLSLRHGRLARRQDAAAQLARRKKDTLRLVDVKPGQGV